MADQLLAGVYRLTTDYAEATGLPLYLYLIGSAGGEWALLDSGVADTPARLGEEFASTPATMRELTVLFNSHAHADHMGGDAAILAQSAAKLAAPAGELDWIEDRACYIRDVWQGPPGVLHRQEPIDAGVLDMCGADVRVDIALRDGDRIRVDDREMEVIVTSGHSPAHLALFDSRSRILFSFDVVQGHGIPRGSGLPRQAPLYYDVARYLKGLERLLAIDFDAVAPSHGPVLDADEGRRHIEESLGFVEELGSFVESLLKARRTVSTRDVAAAIGSDFGDFGGITFQTAYLADAHLRALARAGGAQPGWTVPDTGDVSGSPLATEGDER